MHELIYLFNKSVGSKKIYERQTCVGGGGQFFPVYPAYLHWVGRVALVVGGSGGSIVNYK